MDTFEKFQSFGSSSSFFVLMGFTYYLIGSDVGGYFFVNFILVLGLLVYAGFIVHVRNIVDLLKNYLKCWFSGKNGL